MNANYSNTSMLDMVFEHRNKSYGAYVLRRDSNKTTKQAMISILSVLTVFCLGNFIRENLNVHKKSGYVPNAVFITTDINKINPPAPKIKPPVIPPKHPQTAAAVTTIRNTETHVVAQNQDHQDSIPTNKDLEKAEAGLHTNTVAPGGLGVTDGNGAAHVLDAPLNVQAPALPIVRDWSEVMPEFPGGDKALARFLAQNTQYPDIEHDNGIAGKVITQFTVNEDGTISDIKVLRSPSPGFNREVTRVIKTMPAFKPGLQQGKPVRVRFTLPFVFTDK
jgi:periplasmic protein TonB